MRILKESKFESVKEPSIREVRAEKENKWLKDIQRQYRKVVGLEGEGPVSEENVRDWAIRQVSCSNNTSDDRVRKIILGESLDYIRK